MESGRSRLLLAAAVLAAVAAFWHAGFSEGALFAYVKGNFATLVQLYAAYPLLFIVGCVALHAVIIAALIPGSGVMMLLEGAIFGPYVGVLVAAASNTLGGSLSFLLFRRLLRREPPPGMPPMNAIHAAMERNGWMYVLTLRTVPFLPSQAVSMVMAVTSIGLVPFMTGTWLGSLPSSGFFVYMGRNLMAIERIGDLFTLEVLGSLLGLFAVLVALQLYLQLRSGGFKDIRADLAAFIRWKAGQSAA